MQIGETVRDLGLEGQLKKAGTPTMGGLIIIIAIVFPTILVADLTNIYIQLMLITTLWMGFIGFTDDYIKVFKKKRIKRKIKNSGSDCIGFDCWNYIVFK